LKSVEITGSDALASALVKMEQFNKPVDIEGLLKKHLGRKFTLLYPIVRAFIIIIDAHPPLQLRIRKVSASKTRVRAILKYIGEEKAQIYDCRLKEGEDVT